MEVVIFMAKYNAEFKINIVQKYLEGEVEYVYLAKKSGIKNKSQIHRGSYENRKPNKDVRINRKNHR